MVERKTENGDRRRVEVGRRNIEELHSPSIILNGEEELHQYLVMVGALTELAIKESGWNRQEIVATMLEVVGNHVRDSGVRSKDVRVGLKQRDGQIDIVEI